MPVFATLGIVLDWVVEMAWFLFLVYVCGFPTICHNLVLIPPAVVTGGSPVSLSYFSLFQIMVLLDETFRMVYILLRIFACLVSTEQYMCMQLFIIQKQ
ncbi:hypothetical protein BKA82DRAFT_4198278 [Pisolithus tinctorius]|nr:hypothetical protein BKA82DRAFT_4198278 [Pisolithus tinctorius]